MPVSHRSLQENPIFQATIGEMLNRSVMAMERNIAVLRILFMFALNFRVISRWEQMGASAALLCLASQTALIIYSGFVVSYSKREDASRGIVYASLFFDSVAVFFVLLSNVLWALPDYLGLIRLSDTAAILIVVMVSGLRLSISAAVFGGIVNAV